MEAYIFQPLTEEEEDEIIMHAVEGVVEGLMAMVLDSCKYLFYYNF